MHFFDLAAMGRQQVTQPPREALSPETTQLPLQPRDAGQELSVRDSAAFMAPCIRPVIGNNSGAKDGFQFDGLIMLEVFVVTTSAVNPRGGQRHLYPLFC